MRYDIPDDPRAVVALAERAQANAPERDRLFYDVTLGAALYRAGRTPEAIERLERGRQAENQRASPRASLFLALAHRAQGHFDEARKQRDVLDAAHSSKLGFWGDLELHLLRREVDLALPSTP